ncbi:putative double-stranded binding protein [Danaus plexippus plexippus]|uniref:Double-stranded binding protein n=1 Tax=Danaus plexippus plexippus TaxID=278856 RepID=A0A212F266_DANPL|nr:putative double-stranded binding protein [Danaus plexippus plexippus]
MSEELSPPPKKTKVEFEAETGEIDFADDTIVENKFDIKERCENFLTTQELEQLREFKVLDEVKANEDDSNDDNSEKSSTGVPEEELDKMLDENLPEDFKTAPKPKEKTYVARTKIVLEEKGVNQFENLPLDWMMIRHHSGMPIYMHRSTRVCTLSKPYFIGKENTRRHDIPISAIPCLLYRRALEEEEKQKEIDRQIEEQIKNGMYAQNQGEGIVIKNEEDASTQNTGDFPQISVLPEIKLRTDLQFDRNVNIQQTEIKQDVSDSNDAEPESVEQKYSVTKDSQNNIHDDVTQVADKAMTEIDKKCPLAMITNNGDDKYESQVEYEVTVKIENETSDSEDTIKKEVIDNENNELTSDDFKESERNENGGDVEGIPHRQPVVLPGGIVMPPPRVESVNTSWKTKHLTPEQVTEYCKRLFQFKSLNIMHFNRWTDRRKYTKARKTLQYPTLPAGTTLITIPAQNGGKTAKRDWVMNMNGRSYLSVFHEYVCRALQKQPVYEYKQLENAATPYQAAVYIGGMQYGVGYGSSKRQAKYAAARASIHILIPEMKNHLEPPAAAPQNPETDFTFFDYVGIEDPRIAEFCAATCEPSPHAILRTCLLRNFGAGDRHIHTEMKKLEYQKTELTMTVGKHTATVVCKNKKTAKQRASQAILQALHPHVRSWGSLLRLYGSRSVKSCKEKKLEEQQITLLQDKARQNEPNYAVLDKLRHEMIKLKERDEAVVPIGTLLLTDDLPTHSGSNLNNVDL